MKEEEFKKTLSLVVVGYNVSSIDELKQSIEAKNILKEQGLENGNIVYMPAPQQFPAFPVGYNIQNNDNLSVNYNFMEKKLIIIKENYKQNNVLDEKILSVLKSLLTIAPAASLTAFGINYSTELGKEQKLKLFNKDIEQKLGEDFWNTNIGFETALAFNSDEYTSVYRIYKNEELSKEKGVRCYSFDVNFNFVLKEDDNAKRTIDIFKNNKTYYETYENKKKSILAL